MPTTPNILYVEDVLPEIAANAFKENAIDLKYEEPNITIISYVEDLKKEIHNILSEKYNIVLLDRTIFRGKTDLVLEELLKKNVTTPILSVSAQTDQANIYGIPYIGKTIYNTDTIQKIYSGEYKKNRKSETEKRKKALADILEKEKENEQSKPVQKGLLGLIKKFLR